MNEQELIAALKQQIAASAASTEGSSTLPPFPLEQDGNQKIIEVAEASRKKIAELEALTAERRRTNVRARTDEEVQGDLIAGLGLGAGAATGSLAEISRSFQDLPVLPGIMGNLANLTNAFKDQAYDALGLNKVLQEGQDNIQEVGETVTDYWEDSLSDPRKKAREMKNERLAAAEQKGTLSALAQGLKESLNDPESLVEQGANLAVMAVLGRVGGAQMAITAGAGLQGGDVAGQTREALDKLDASYFQALPEYQQLVRQGVSAEDARRQITDQKAKESFVAGAATSLALNSLLPGANSIENVLAGTAARATTLKGTAGNILKGVVGEGATEAGEEGLGKLASNERVQTVNPAQSLSEGVGSAAGMGLGMGLQLGGSLNTLSGVAEYAGAKADEIAAEMAKAKAQAASVEEAIQSGDVSALLDPKKPSYDPVKGLGALYGNSQLEGTSEEQKAANRSKAAETVAALEDEYTSLKDRFEQISPEGIKARKAAITVDEKELAGLDPASERAQLLKDRIELRKETVAEAEATSSEDLKKIEADILRSERVLAESRKVFAQFSAEAAPSEEEVSALITQVNATESTETAPVREAAERLVSLAMRSSEALSFEQAEALASNTKNGLTEAERKLLRTFSEARQAELSLKTESDVQSDVLYGFNGGKRNGVTMRPMMGILDYRREVGSALAASDQRTAQRYIKQMEAFAQDHKAKAQAMKQAYDEVLETGERRQVLKFGSDWEVRSNLIPFADATRAGGLTFHQESPKVAQMVAFSQKEVEALDKALAELKAGYDMKFSPSAKATQATSVNSVNPEAASAAETEQSTNESSQNQSNENATVDPSTSEPESLTEAQDALDDQPESTQVTEDSFTEATDESKQDGTLDVLKTGNTGDPNLSWNDRFNSPDFNLAAATLTQQKMNENLASKKPLVVVKDFLSKLFSGDVAPYEFLDMDSEFFNISEKADRMRGAIRHFASTAKRWNPILKANFMRNPKPENGFVYEDMMQYFYMDQADGSIDVDENVKTAISYAAYRYLKDAASAPRNLTREQINTMHGRDKDEFIPRNRGGEKALRELTVFEDTLINQLGSVAAQALGLKLKEGASADVLARTKTALGAHALELLLNPQSALNPKDTQALFTRVELPQKQVQYMLGEGQSRAEEEAAIKKLPKEKQVAAKKKLNDAWRVTNTYIKLTRNTKGEMLPFATAVKNAQSKSGSVIDKLFAIEDAPLMAQTKPQKFVQKFAAGTRQLVTDLQAKVINATMQIPHTVIPEMYAAAQILGKENVLQIAGARLLEDDRIHVAHRDSIEAQNENLSNQWDLMEDMLLDPANEMGVDTPFYVMQEVWKNFRAGFLNQSLNMQTSKIHRFLFQREGWRTTLDMADYDQMAVYLTAVAGAMGIKIDQQRQDDNILALDSLMQKPEMKEVIDYLIETVVDENALPQINETLNARIAEIAASREGMMTFQAMVSYAKYQHAVNTNQRSFETTLLVGVDGKTNGPMLTHLALGAAPNVDALFTILNRGGFYSQDEGQAEHFAEYYKDKKGLDLYQDLAKNVLTRVRAGMPKELWASIEVVTKTLMEGDKVASGGRNMVKTPLTAFAFGSSVFRSIQAMEDAFVDGIYTAMEDLASGKRRDITRVQLIQAMNRMIQYGRADAPLFDTNMEIEALLQTELSWIQEQGIRQFFKDAMAEPVKDTMETYFAAFIKRRKRLNRTLNAGFVAFDTLWKDAVKKEKARLVESGEIASRVIKEGKDAGKRVATQELTEEQEQALMDRLKKYLPVVHTDYSWREGNLGAGIMMAKNEAHNVSERPYANKIYMKSKKINAGSTLRRNTEPGVAGTPYMIHSMDSAAMHKAIEKVPGIMNVHDEAGHSVAKVNDVAKAINETVLDSLLYYSPAREALELIERQVVTLAAEIQQGKVDKNIVNELFDMWASNLSDRKNFVAPVEAGKLLLTIASLNAYQADSVRLGAIAKMKYVDQYSWEGGQFEITDQMRATAQDLLSKVKKEPWEQATAAMEYLTNIYKEIGKAPSVASEVQNEIEGNQEAKSAQQLGVPGVMAGTVTEALAEQMPEVAEAVAQGKKIEEAINSSDATTVEERVEAEDRRTDLMQTIAQAAANIPASLVSPWGVIGTSSQAPNAAMVQAFREKPVMSAKEAIALAFREFKKQSDLPKNVAEFQAAMFMKLSELIAEDVVVKYVTPDTPIDAALGIEKGARGWFVANRKDGKTLKEIYILSEDHAASMVTPELLMHELIHAALSGVIALEMQNRAKNPNAQSAGRELIENLEALLEKAKEQDSEGKFGQALTDIQELVSWGLTNLAFQKEVLAKVQMQRATAKNKLISGMRWFVDAVVGYLFRTSDKSKQQRMNNGLGQLIQNVAGLYALAQATPNAYELLESNASFKMAATVASYTAEDLFNALDSSSSSVSGEFKDQLRGVLKTIVTTVQGAQGSLSEATMNQVNGSPLDIWAKALVSGEAAFAAQSQAAGFKISEQERFVMDQVEVTVRAALTDNSGQTTSAARELRKLYLEARKKLVPGDFDRVLGSAQGKALYDFVFKLEADASGRSDYLSRFAAVGMAHEGMRQILGFATTTDTRSLRDMPLSEKLSTIFERMLGWISSKLTHTFKGQQADAKLVTLVTQLAEIESRRRHKIMRSRDETDLLAPVEDMADKLVSKVKGSLESLVDTHWIRDSKSGIVRGGRAVVKTWAGDRADLLMENIARLRDQSLKSKHGMMISLLNELRGPREVLQGLLRMAKKNERERKAVISRTTKEIKSYFLNNGKYLTPETRAALSKMMLRTGAYHLLDSEDFAGFQALVTDPTARQRVRKDLEKQLSAFPKFNQYFINQAKALAFFRVTGKVKSAHLMMNTSNIARMYGTQQEGALSTSQAAAVIQILDKLVALYGFDYVDPNTRELVGEVIKVEAGRGGVENGIAATLLTHKRLAAESMTRLFSGSEALMMQGYMPEIYSPHVSVRTAKRVEGAELVHLGYKEVGQVQKDPADPDQEVEMLYVMTDGGLSPHLTGAMSLTGTNAKGSKLHNGFMLQLTDEGAANSRTQQIFAARKTKAIERLFRDTTFDPTAVKETFQAPILNADGAVTNYRYLMQEDTKDEHLERNSRFDDLLGALAGSIYDKETTTEQNTNVIKALKEVYKTEYARKPDSFVVVGPNSPDPELREAYALLPKETRNQIKAIWGGAQMTVPYDALNIIFGYRKASVSTVFEKENRNLAEKILVSVVEGLLYQHARFNKKMSADAAEKYQRRAAMVVRRAENIWQEVVKEVKDIIVVKTGVVLLGNVTSNISLLIAEGVPFKSILENHRVAIKGAQDYMKQAEQLHALKMQLESGYLLQPQNEIEAEIVRLESDLKNNPVGELIEAGLMPTIVEDVATEEDLYSYKSYFVKKMDKYASKLHPTVLGTGKFVYMAHDTALYQGLSKGTQLSDFVARYTLYQHLISRKKNPLSKEEAIQHASNAFVNYDIPMQKELQYLDDMGLVMFTKYFLRIQRVLAKLVRDRPLQVLMMVAMNNFFGGMPIVTDSSALFRIGNNPLEIGALNFPFTLDDLGTVSATMSLLK